MIKGHFKLSHSELKTFKMLIIIICSDQNIFVSEQE